MRPKCASGCRVATKPYTPSATTPAPIHAHPRCSFTPCQISHAPPISATAARTKSRIERVTVMAQDPTRSPPVGCGWLRLQGISRLHRVCAVQVSAARDRRDTNGHDECGQQYQSRMAFCGLILDFEDIE